MFRYHRPHSLQILLMGVAAIAVLLCSYCIWLYRHDRFFHNTLSLHLFALLTRPGDHKLLLIGDSNIASLSCPMTFLRWQVLNLGFPGIGSQQLEGYLGEHLEDLPQIDAGLLWVGVNDARTEALNIEEASKSENKIIDYLSKISKTVAVLTQPLLPNEGRDIRIDNSNRHLIELNSSVAARAGGRLAIISPFTGAGNEANVFSADGLHLNNIGYQKVCSAIGRWLDRSY